MKKITLLLVALFTTGTMIMAQGGPRGGQRNMDPKDRAERMTERMVKEYSLNDTQKKELYEVNLEMAQKMTPPQQANSKKETKQRGKKDKSEANRSSKEDREKAAADRKQASDDYDAKVKKIFTKEQYEAYTKNQAERQKRMGERGPRPQRANN